MNDWIKKKMGLSQDQVLTREALDEYQTNKISEVITLAKENSPFYMKHLKDIIPETIKNLKDFEKIPFLSATHIRESALQMLCVGQDQISRIVTLQTSGTTGPQKRIYFTPEDQELTIDFFHNGMKYIVNQEDNVLILMPCRTRGSIGELLSRGLDRLGASFIPYGLPDDFRKLAKLISEKNVTSIVGIPSHILQLAETHKEWGEASVRSVLLSADYVPSSLAHRLEKIWGCKVFEHYGMTEMGLGGAVQCEFLRGMHPRETDLYFEIVDPQTGNVLEDGEFGEIAVTTLTRRGMPLIRYRTGDYGRWLQGDCPCGTVLKSLDKVRHRVEDVVLINGQSVDITQLDEALFTIEKIFGYDARVIEVDGEKKIQLDLHFSLQSENITGQKRRIRQ